MAKVLTVQEEAAMVLEEAEMAQAEVATALEVVATALEEAVRGLGVAASHEIWCDLSAPLAARAETATPSAPES